MDVHVTCKYEEDPIKNEGARQGSHRNSKSKFHDYSMINNEISMIILCVASSLPFIGSFTLLSLNVTKLLYAWVFLFVYIFIFLLSGYIISK